MPFDFSQIVKNIASSRSVKTRVARAVLERFEIAKNLLLSEFDNHPVTREIKAGPLSENISNTLGGRGNLFTFLGFESGSDPIFDLRDTIVRELVIKEQLESQGSVRANSIYYRSVVYFPFSEIRQATPMPWEAGLSWALGIEEGISNFSHYVFTRKLIGHPNRSGHGIQNPAASFGGEFATTPYLSKMFQDLQHRLI